VLLASGTPLRASGNALLVAGKPLLVAGNALLVAGSTLPASGNALLVADNALLAAGSALLAAGNALQGADDAWPLRRRSRQARRLLEPAFGCSRSRLAEAQAYVTRLRQRSAALAEEFRRVTGHSIASAR
jgi:hypothetical protein